MIFIAEIGLNYNGNFNLAYELIKQAKYSGADIVKFQLGWRAEPGEINYIDDENIETLIRWCNYFNVGLMFSVFTKKHYEMAKRYGFNRYKIASRTLKDNFDLVKKVIADENQVIISLGMWGKEELPIDKTPNISYLWCKSKYPTEPWDLIDFPKAFTKSHFDGYSDHSIGIEMPLLAIARGARIIEKHFTLDKSSSIIRDHVLSATPEEFKRMVEIGRDLYEKISLGV